MLEGLKSCLLLPTLCDQTCKRDYKYSVVLQFIQLLKGSWWLVSRDATVCDLCKLSYTLQLQTETDWKEVQTNVP